MSNMNYLNPTMGTPPSSAGMPPPIPQPRTGYDQYSGGGGMFGGMKPPTMPSPQGGGYHGPDMGPVLSLGESSPSMTQGAPLPTTMQPGMGMPPTAPGMGMPGMASPGGMRGGGRYNAIANALLAQP